MNISGSGSIAAGDYNEKVSISGSGRIDGNLRCVAFSCSGSAKSSGYIACSDDVHISGSCKVEKDMSAKSIHVSGAASVGGSITVQDDLKISGGAKCRGDIKCAVLRCSGSVDIGGEVEAEEARISGRITCSGLLNAEKVDISLDGSGSKVGAIGGSEIKIYSGKSKNSVSRMPLLAKIVGAASGSLTVDECIEGDIVAIECVSSPKVVGRIVAIGQGCDVELVQYSEEIEISPDAKVARQEKI